MICASIAEEDCQSYCRSNMKDLQLWAAKQEIPEVDQNALEQQAVNDAIDALEEEPRDESI